MHQGMVFTTKHVIYQVKVCFSSPGCMWYFLTLQLSVLEWWECYPFIGVRDKLPDNVVCN